MTPPEPQTPDVPEGMVAWAGGEHAPDDWDGGPVLFGDHTKAMPIGWKSGFYKQTTVIAYTPRREQPAIVGGVEREALLRDTLCVVRGSIGDLKKGFAKSVDPARWVEQLIAYIDAALTARPSAPAEVETCNDIACPQIAMGHGKVDVGVIHWQERTGLLLRPRDHVIPVGEPGEIAGDYWPAPTDLVIWIDSPAGADTILTELAPLGSAPAPVEPGSERDCCKPDDVVVPRSYLESWLVTLQHARTFIVSREKMHPTGVGLYDDDIAQIQSILVISPVPSGVDQ